MEVEIEGIRNGGEVRRGKSLVIAGENSLVNRK
jgi:hypothetical protein